MTVVSNEGGIIMIETGAREVDEEVILGGLAMAHEANLRLIRAQKDLFAQLGIKKREFTPKALDRDKLARIEQEHGPALLEAMQVRGKRANQAALSAVMDAALAKVPEENLEDRVEVRALIHKLEEKLFRELALKKRGCARTDGASTTSAPSRSTSRP